MDFDRYSKPRSTPRDLVEAPQGKSDSNRLANKRRRRGSRNDTQPTWVDSTTTPDQSGSKKSIRIGSQTKQNSSSSRNTSRVHDWLNDTESEINESGDQGTSITTSTANTAKKPRRRSAPLEELAIREHRRVLLGPLLPTTTEEDISAWFEGFQITDILTPHLVRGKPRNLFKRLSFATQSQALEAQSFFAGKELNGVKVNFTFVPAPKSTTPEGNTAVSVRGSLHGGTDRMVSVETNVIERPVDSQPNRSLSEKEIKTVVKDEVKTEVKDQMQSMAFKLVPCPASPALNPESEQMPQICPQTAHSQIQQQAFSQDQLSPDLSLSQLSPTLYQTMQYPALSQNVGGSQRLGPSELISIGRINWPYKRHFKAPYAFTRTGCLRARYKHLLSYLDQSGEPWTDHEKKELRRSRGALTGPTYQMLVRDTGETPAFE